MVRRAAPTVTATTLGVMAALVTIWVTGLTAHPMSQNNAAYVQGLQGPAIGPFVYLGAKHMVTGYDHLLFLVGVIFFLYRMSDVILYVSLFTVGHSVTLLAGVLAGVRVNPSLVDAIIGLSVVYKGFENIGGFDRLIGIRPDTRAAVLVFGLVHGLGLATRLQDVALAPTGLLTNLVSFNVGVELGQVLALTGVLLVLGLWRTQASFVQHALVANTGLMAAGFVLAGSHAIGYFVATS